MQSKKRKINLLHIASGDLWAGAEVQLFTLCSCLAEDHETNVSVLLLNKGELEKRLRDIGITVIVFDETRVGFFRLAQLVGNYCKSNKIDLVHSHGYKVNILTSICSIFGKFASIRTVHGAQEFKLPFLSVAWCIDRLDKLTGKYIQSSIVAVSEDLKSKLLPIYGRKLFVVRNGVSEVIIERGKKLDKKNCNIGIVGRLTKIKRIDLFLQMAACLLKESLEQNLVFYIVGDGPLRKDLELLANKLEISSSVQFVGQVESALPWIASFDLLVMSSDHEGTPMTLLEAMYIQTPIVAHRVGGLSELLAEGRGWLVDQQSPRMYADKVQEVLRKPVEVKQTTDRAKQAVTDFYSARQNACGYLSIYKSVLSK